MTPAQASPPSSTIAPHRGPVTEEQPLVTGSPPAHRHRQVAEPDADARRRHTSGGSGSSGSGGGRHRPNLARRWARGAADDPSWARPALLVLLGVTAVLYLWNLSASGYANSFYAAATQAGSQSWKALLFGSLDAGNAITVDKPPASLWVSGLSARIFGFSSWSVLVPQALEGVAAVGLLAATVRRTAGVGAGLLAGAAFALTPVAALMFRFDNPDALLVLLLVGAAYATVRALERASWRWLTVAGTCLGFAFLTKLAQAFLIVPALGLAYLIAAPTGLRRRLPHLLAGLGAIIVSAGWYVALVDLWPAGSRPYIGGSTNNSLWQLALGYNGLGRIVGATAGSGGGGGGGGGMGGSFGGPTGITRLFAERMGGEISWLLPAALIALVAGLWATRRAPRTDAHRAGLLLWGGWLLVSGLVFSYMSGIIHPYYTAALAPAIAALVAGVGVALWRLRDRRSARIALAAMVAVTGAWNHVLLDRVSTWLPALRWIILIGCLLVAVALAVGAAGRPTPGRPGRLAVVLALATVLGLGTGSTAYTLATVSQAHTGSTPSAGPAAASSMGGGFGRGMRGNAPGQPPAGTAGPTTTSTAGPTTTSTSGTSTTAGASSSTTSTSTTRSTGTTSAAGAASSTTGTTSTDGARPAGGGMGGGQSANAELVALLSKSTTTWAAATSGATTAAELELASGQSVIAIGGWDGSDPAPTLTQFQQWVTEGRIHYFIFGGGMGGGMGGNSSTSTASQIAAWIAAHYTATTVGSQTVYDLTATATS
ncbi:glycosyltransferase family 39 protein [Frankia sp. AgPm24]|uniref:ArnT family glycosyltransferase n=1 Tax=Frankia sp. AgPm24 TaxID=631128 RepID=UPI002551F5B2|nr:glycosyltransferase family 39 protein [Frankia sp. AgPm24]